MSWNFLGKTEGAGEEEGEQGTKHGGAFSLKTEVAKG